jgi:general secretion pathway protein D
MVMKQLTKKSLAALVALAAVLAPAAAIAQPKDAKPADKPGDDDDPDPAADAKLYNCKKAKGKVSVSFKPEIELKDLITWAMGFTCKNFMYEQGITSRSKKLTIIAPNEITAQEAYRVFLVGLSTMGLTVVPKGDVLKIVESSQAKSETVPIKRGTPGASDEFVRMILRPSNVQAQDLSDALQAVKSPEGDIKVIGKAGIVLVTDYASHVKDMATLTREIDKPSEGAGVYTIKVVHRDAKEIADVVGNVLGTAGGGAGAAAPAAGGKGGRTTAADIEAAVPSKVLADERTNSLILVSNEAAYLRVRALVKRLDVPDDITGSGAMHVHPLENAKAEELAQTLNNALQGLTSPQGGQQGSRRRGADQPAPAPSTGGAAAGLEGAAFEGDVKITHDTPTNSLVVISSGRDFIALREVIEKLDAPRRQVFIEAVILELQASNDMNLGTSFHGALPTDSGGFGIGGLQHSNLSSVNLSSLATLTGLIGGIFGELVPESEEFLGLGRSIPSYGVLFQALAKNRNANVLSSPHILTTDNVEAEISVGQNIPYLGAITLGLGSSGGTGGIPGLGSQSIQRQDIALTMKITPHVNQSDMVRLDIEQEIQDVGERDPQLGPTWTKRKIKTTVVVRDQQSIVIGGLMSDRVTYSESKIPILGDIPILGYLFKYTERAKQKTNLLVLLTPYIIEDQIDIDRIVERKVRERSEFLRSFSVLDTAKYLPQIDYRKKRGLVEEINSAVEAVERDIELLRTFDQDVQVTPDGAIRYEEEDLPEPGADAGGEPIQIEIQPAEQPAPQPEKPATPPKKTRPKAKE